MSRLVYETEMTEERRTTARKEAYLTAELERSEGRSTIAITRDISPTGILVFTRPQLEVGEAITLIVGLGGSRYTVTGTVVRQEKLEPHELWRNKVAIAVDIDDPVVAELHATLAALDSSR